MNSKVTFTRVEKILDYIHDHIREPLSLEDLAVQSCWSRWQLQRVFQDYTGFSVAQYVREMKLSESARALLQPGSRIIDVAVEFGFNSEISYSRSFKKYFGQSPKVYRKEGVLTGIKTPLTNPSDRHVNYPDYVLYQVRLERKKSFEFMGLSSVVNGLKSITPDFADSVPRAWQRFFDQMTCDSIHEIPHIALIDDCSSGTEGELCYWTGIETIQMTPELKADSESLQFQRTSEYDYAVLPYQGPVDEFHKAVFWLIANWLPSSGYSGVDEAFEIERYLPPFQSGGRLITAEYWLPIVPY